jgi:UDP-N-acetylmuramate dehydrogenase
MPGTVGGAIYGSAQAFGSKMSEIIKSVQAVDLRTLQVRDFTNEQCEFFSKNSLFKKNKNLIIISAILQFEHKNPEEIKNRIKENIQYRKAKHPMEFPSVGSVFINPEVIIKNKKLLERFPELIIFNRNRVIPAGYLIAKAGLAGKRHGNAQISEKHSNFIINLGGASSGDILSLIKSAQSGVKKSFGLKLEPEVQMVGF